MTVYPLAYAQENLPELFEEARNGEDVIIQRSDGRRCQLLPVADVKEEERVAEATLLSDAEIVGVPAPA